MGTTWSWGAEPAISDVWLYKDLKCPELGYTRSSNLFTYFLLCTISGTDNAVQLPIWKFRDSMVVNIRTYSRNDNIWAHFSI